MKTISFFGSSLVSAYWNGAATYYRGILRALARRGYSITFYEPDAFQRQQHRDMDNPDWARVVVYPCREEDLYRVLREASSADVLVKASGVGVFDSQLEQAVLEFRDPDSAVIFWDVDAPATLDRVRNNPDDPFRDLIPKYDLILTYGGGPPVVREYLRLGARTCVPIYNALDPSTHYPVPTRQCYNADLLFLGNRLPDREVRVEQFFLEPAVRLPRRKFILGGAGWDDKPRPSNVKYIGHVYTSEHNALNSSAWAVLNISRESMARCGYSPATRVFEAAGAGACIISDCWEGISQFLDPGKEILVAKDGGEVKALVEDLNPLRAREIGKAALKRVLAQHTYAHRAAQVDVLLKQFAFQAAGIPA